MFSVTISEKGGQQSQYDFSKPEITIGRMKGNDIVLPKGNVSKQHTRIFLREDSFYIVDLKSTNGTYVNGRKVNAEQAISETDKVYIGDFILQLKRQQAQQPGGPGAGAQPPQPPGASGPGNAPGGGPGRSQSQGGGGRHFPTVMDGARDDMSAPSGGLATGAGLDSQQSNRSSGSPSSALEQLRQNRNQRSSTSPGGSSAGGPKSTSPGNGGQKRPNDPSGGEDLRKTYGDSSPPADLVPELEPEPLEPEMLEPEPLEPEPLDDGPGGSGLGSALQTPPPGGPSVSGPAPPSKPSSASGSREPSKLDSLGRPADSEASTAISRSSSLQSGGDSKDSASSSSIDIDAPMATEFDSDFHRAQQDVARVFFESMPADELPLDYPLDDKLAEGKIARAIKSAVNTVSPGVDKQTLIDALTKEATGLGPLEDYLDDDEVRSIYINAHDRIIVRRDATEVLAKHAYSHVDMLDLAARRLLGPQENPPVSDEVRFSDGTQVHIVMPPIAVDGPVLTVRKPNQHFPSLQELAQQGALSPGMAEFLKRTVQANRSVLIAGPTSSGKSTLLAAMASQAPAASRIIAVEQHSDLPIDKPNFIRLEASPASGFDMQLLLRNAVAMHPDRILVDECRGAEAYDWVTAATTGTEGSMMTLHGTSAVDALSRLQSMCLLSASEISPRGLREQVARSVDLVVVVNGTPDSGFRVQQIAEVQGIDIDAFRLNDIFYYRVEGTDGDFHPTGYIPLFYEDLRHAGFDVDLAIFRE